MTLFSQNRPYSYEKINCLGLNVMLNSNDVSEYLKISADGLEVGYTASSLSAIWGLSHEAHVAYV